MGNPGTTDLAVQVLTTAGLIVRLVLSALAAFFVLSALATPLANRWPHQAFTSLRDVAKIVVVPMRRMFNREVADDPYDPSPLVAALVAVLLGLGIESFLGLIVGIIAG